MHHDTLGIIVKKVRYFDGAKELHVANLVPSP